MTSDTRNDHFRRLVYPVAMASAAWALACGTSPKQTSTGTSEDTPSQTRAEPPPSSPPPQTVHNSAKPSATEALQDRPAGPVVADKGEARNGDSVDAVSETESSPLGRLLRAHVDDNGMVDYAGLKKEQALLESIVTDFAGTSRADYDAWSSSDQLAFLINAYNVYTLALIVRKYPVDSIQRLSKPWDRRGWTLLGKKVSLNDIEHKYIRKWFDEPRIHFALVCAAMGCPPLQNEVWEGDRLEEQFERPIRHLMAHPKKFRIERDKKRVSLSRLFEWYGKDFVSRHLPQNGFEGKSKTMRAVLNFFARYLTEEDATFLNSGTYSVRFTRYDWSLNTQ